MDWKSSYEKNDFGTLFYSLVKIIKPDKIVELGTKAGYSAYHMAKAVKENDFGSIDCYDLWDGYPFNSCSLNTAKENLQEYSDIISFFKTDARKIEEKYNSVDLLHIDLGNHAEILEEILIPWLPKAKLIIMEGGSIERDNVEWMKKYNKKSINQWLKNKPFNYVIINPFPSVTLIENGKGH
ncbi:MAG: class I SAM-dependent methyltransferase [Candidatus Nanoarchaeia archaeon]|nr:class I SAM-dependent methyltransferase [Candidatus Nanoarchaeia archaeon]MDD5741441.1 class I SAM-dependent methyltransferase [Candidatus Nanoarchaeia archaeon]